MSTRTTKGNCSSCDDQQLARNHYFTGKLLVERDFVDEQRFFLGKNLRHNRFLHGAGTVCGLRVSEHPRDACRDRYVMVAPGVAIDGCGQEIVVPREECVPLPELVEARFREEYGDVPFPGEVDVQICIRYRECPTEEIPALLDECAGEEPACAPNRILESYELDVMLNAPRRDPGGKVRLEWRETLINASEVRRVAVHGESRRIYVLTGGTGGTVYAFDADTRSMVGSHSVPEAYDIAVSEDGATLYVTADHDESLRVLDAAGLGPASALLRTVRIDGTDRRGLHVRTVGDRLWLFAEDAPQVRVWSRDIDDPGTDPDDALVGTIDLGGQPGDIALGPDRRWFFVSRREDGALALLRTDDVSPARTVEMGSRGADRLAVTGRAGGGYRVLVSNRVAREMTLLTFGEDPTTGPDPIVAEAPSTGWDERIVALEAHQGTGLVLSATEDGGGVLRAIDLDAFARDEDEVPAERIDLRPGLRDATWSDDRRELFVPWSGGDDGGVAIVRVTPLRCDDLVTRSLEPCPDDQPRCVVLATIEGYRPGAVVTNDRIDNVRDRVVLPSVSMLADALRCLELRGGIEGPRGERGPRGPTGPAGERGEPGRDGADGEGLRDDLAHICAVSWDHGQPLTEAQTRLRQLIVLFDKGVRAEDLSHRTVILEMEKSHTVRVPGLEYAEYEWREVREAIVPFTLRGGPRCRFPIDPDDIIRVDRGDLAHGVAIRPKHFEDIFAPGRAFRVRLLGDFIRDNEGISADLDNVAGRHPMGDSPWVGFSNRFPHRTGDGVPGGEFISWFFVDG